MKGYGNNDNRCTNDIVHFMLTLIDIHMHTLAVGALYETARKQTFLPMIVMAGTHIPVLIRLILLYPCLVPREKDRKEAASGGSDDKINQQGNSESSQLLQDEDVVE